MTAYVTRAEVTATFDTAPTAQAKLDRIDSLIASASSELDAELGFTFERKPASSTATFVVRGRGGSVLHIHGDVEPLAVVPTSISFAPVWAGTPVLVASADYVLEQWDPSSGQYDHVRLLGVTSGFSEFPDGYGLVSIVGAQGFAAVPANVKEAVIARVRQLYHADPALVGGIVGPEEAGRVVMQPRWPDEFFKVVRHYKSRYSTCYYR
jgi:hypothetical protein